MTRKWIAILALACIGAQRAPSDAETAAANGIASLRSMTDAVRTKATRDVALQIRKLPSGPTKVKLALELSNLSTEGEYGYVTLKRTTDTLADAVTGAPPVDKAAYVRLANLVRYEGMQVELQSGAYLAALAEVDALAKERAAVDFTLTDRAGKAWTLSALKGKVVLVDFWAAGRPSEGLDLDALGARLKDKGLVILAVTDAAPETVDAYLKERPAGFPVLLDPGGEVKGRYRLEGVPASLVYDRKGRLVAPATEVRTMPQLLRLLAKAGLK